MKLVTAYQLGSEKYREYLVPEYDELDHSDVLDQPNTIAPVGGYSYLEDKYSLVKKGFRVKEV